MNKNRTILSNGWCKLLLVGLVCGLAIGRVGGFPRTFPAILPLVGIALVVILAVAPFRKGVRPTKTLDCPSDLQIPGLPPMRLGKRLGKGAEAEVWGISDLTYFVLPEIRLVARITQCTPASRAQVMDLHSQAAQMQRIASQQLDTPHVVGPFSDASGTCVATIMTLAGGIPLESFSRNRNVRQWESRLKDQRRKHGICARMHTVLMRLFGPPCPERLSKGEALDLGLSILRRLKSLHEVGVVHGDLKPGHILLDKITSEPSFLDWGLAGTIGMRLRGYSRDFAPPEVMHAMEQGEPCFLEPALDVHCAGRILLDVGLPPGRWSKALMRGMDSYPDARALSEALSREFRWLLHWRRLGGCCHWLRRLHLLEPKLVLP